MELNREKIVKIAENGFHRIFQCYTCESGYFRDEVYRLMLELFKQLPEKDQKEIISKCAEIVQVNASVKF